MTTENSTNSTWDRAIRTVLQEEGGPLHYKEIAHRIAERGLVTSRGATPEATVNSNLGRMVNQGTIARAGRGIYSINPVTSDSAEIDDITVQEETDLARVTAYGLYWERDKVYWEPGQGRTRKYRLPGSADDSEDVIEFGDQWGVYILYDGSQVVYVGQSMKGIFGRLSLHNHGRRRNSRWDRFSWFGFRAVNTDGTLSDERATFSTAMLVTILESVMIEGFMPPLNDQGGQLMGTVYRQVEAPELVAQRETELRRMLGQALAPG